MTIAVTDPISIPKGTYGINLNFTVYNNDGTVHDLTSYTSIKFQVWKAGVPGTLAIDGSVTKDVPASGTCHYTVAQNDFATVGRYLWQLQLTKTDYEDHTDAGQLVVTEAG